MNLFGLLVPTSRWAPVLLWERLQSVDDATVPREVVGVFESRVPPGVGFEPLARGSMCCQVVRTSCRAESVVRFAHRAITSDLRRWFQVIIPEGVRQHRVASHDAKDAVRNFFSQEEVA